jgi:Putative transposase of IS4/5 family (DUF4096)
MRSSSRSRCAGVTHHLTDLVWQRLRHLLVRPDPTSGRPCPEWRWREYVDAISYVNLNRTGCTWRMLPHDFAVSCSAAHKHFLRWAATAPRTVPSPSLAARSAMPTAALRASGRVIDSCSINASPVRGPRGFDAAKKLDGIKRHVVVDTWASR